MKALLDDEWQDGFLDYHRDGDDCRIKVLAFMNLNKIDGLYFVRSRKYSLIWNYLREIGPREVLRKVVSRSGERFRNQKYISCGIGRMLGQPDGSELAADQLVAFLAPCHPACVERIVIPPELLVSLDDSFAKYIREDSIAYLSCAAIKDDDQSVRDLQGWSSHSGQPLPEPLSPQMCSIVDMLAKAEWVGARYLPIADSTEVQERRFRGVSKPSEEGKKAVLFGYGNYAKTVIIPNIGRYIDLACIHEVDPLQMSRRGVSCAWDVSPAIRPDEAYEVFLIAGYHHTHAPLALGALERGAYAVVEKPIVVDQAQLAGIVKAVSTHGEKLFSCFHKRYLPFNRYAVEDLAVACGESISYHCIVYEVPLPQLHWYRWPNSKSRLISNGCHWIDHFMYLNGFSRHRSVDLFVDVSGTINVSMSLENGALFTMVLTDKGSDRIGVQDYIELRAGSVTIKMTNGSDYLAENDDKIIRKSRINKMQSYRNMYREIGKAIREGGSGDSIESIKASNSAVLKLEEIYSQKQFQLY